MWCPLIEYYDDVIKNTWLEWQEAGYDGPGWYFWDEVQMYCYGPYKTADDARLAEQEYADTL